MYVILSGAKCNLGDFLIVERTLALLRALRPDRALHVLPSWKPLDLKSEAVQSARAILIAGGPGYQRNFYPDVYPLVPNLASLPCPVIPLGVGWKGRSASDDAIREYVFSPRSLEALRFMSERTPSLGCRDPLTEAVLHRNGIHNVSMIGCPVWFDLDSIGHASQPHQPVERIVFTPPQARELTEQSLEIAKHIALTWPDAEKICSFHRGLQRESPWVSADDLENNRRISETLAAAGFRSVDATADLEKIRFYAECDLHVGYRLHAHLDFLSRRQRSLLIEEDGRGAGASLALGIEGDAAYREASRIPWRARLRGSGTRPMEVDPQTPQRVAARITQDVRDGFARYDALGDTLDAAFVTMSEFLRDLP